MNNFSFIPQNYSEIFYVQIIGNWKWANPANSSNKLYSVGENAYGSINVPIGFFEITGKLVNGQFIMRSTVTAAGNWVWRQNSKNL